LAWDDLERQTNCRWRMALGVLLSAPPFHDYGPSPVAFGHAGAGGANAFADPAHQLSFAFLPVRLFPSGGAGLRGPRLIAAVYECLGAPMLTGDGYE
jgi:CubicO group peptidase (beta-lactamase class C family)